MRTEFISLIVSILLTAPTLIQAAIPASVVREAVEAALRKGGREAVDPAVRRAAMEAGEQIARRHGRSGLRLLADGGMEAAQVLARHGDEAVRISQSLSPAARRMLVTHADTLIPLGRRLGTEAVEQAAKSPHTAVRLLNTYGDDVGMRILRQAPAEDLPRALRYLDAADSPATREAFLKAYRLEGSSIFQRIPPSLVVAGGLSTAMIVGTVRVTKPLVEIGEQIAKQESDKVWEDFTNLATQIHLQTLYVLAAVLLILLWRPTRKYRYRMPSADAAAVKTRPPCEGETR